MYIDDTHKTFNYFNSEIYYWNQKDFRDIATLAQI